MQKNIRTKGHTYRRTCGTWRARASNWNQYARLHRRVTNSSDGKSQFRSSISFRYFLPLAEWFLRLRDIFFSALSGSKMKESVSHQAPKVMYVLLFLMKRSDPSVFSIARNCSLAFWMPKTQSKYQNSRSLIATCTLLLIDFPLKMVFSTVDWCVSTFASSSHFININWSGYHRQECFLWNLRAE